MSCRIIEAKAENTGIKTEADGTSALAAERKEPSAFVAKKWKIKSSGSGLTYTPLSGNKTEKTAPADKSGEKGSLAVIFEEAVRNGVEKSDGLSEKNCADIIVNKDGEKVTEEGENTEAPEKDVYIAVGSEYVRADGGAVRNDNRRSLPATGIIYEIAEELYMREKTRTEIEALCQPPFRRVFDSERIEQLDQEAKERTLRLLPPPEPKPNEEESAPPTELPKQITTAKAFFLELLLMLPVIDIIAAVILSFGSGRNAGVRSFARGHLILSLMIMSAVLVFFAYGYFTAPDSGAFIERLSSLFS